MARARRDDARPCEHVSLGIPAGPVRYWASGLSLIRVCVRLQDRAPAARQTGWSAETNGADATNRRRRRPAALFVSARRRRLAAERDGSFPSGALRGLVVAAGPHAPRSDRRMGDRRGRGGLGG